MQLGRALQLLSDGLKPYGYLEIAELLELLEKLIVKSDAVRKRAIQSETVMAHDLRSMSQEDVQAILDQEYFTKKQLVELGSERFGISRGKLIRLRKKDALESIRGALEHEKSLDVISIEARRAGKRGLAKL